MKRYRNLGLALCALLAAGCDNGADSLPGDATDLRGTPLLLQKVSIEAEEEEPATRAAVTAWTNTDQVGLVSYYPTYGYTDDRSIYPYTYTDASWTTKKPLLLNRHNTNVYVYYPYSASDTDPRKIAMPMYAAASDAEADKSLARGVATDRSSNYEDQRTIKSVELTHAYCKTEIWLTTYSGISSLAGATVRSITLEGYPTSATLDIIKNECTVNTMGSFVCTKEEKIPASNSSDVLYSTILIPPVKNPGREKQRLLIDVDGVITTCHIDPDGYEGAEGANKYHRLTISFSARSIAVASVQARDWVKSSLEVESKPSIE